MNKVVRVFVVVAVIGLGAVAGWWFLPRENAVQDQSGSIQVSTVQAGQGVVRVTVEGRASVAPVRTMTVRSGLSGVLTAVPEVGDRFAAGQVMVRFDSGDFEKAIRQAELNLNQATLNRERAESGLDQARNDLTRTNRLAQSGAATGDQVDQATAALRTADFALRSAELAVEQAELTLESARSGLERAVIRAPFSGVVTERGAGAGDVVASSVVLLTFADLSSVRVQAEVDEFDIGKVAVGMRVTVTADALGDESRSSTVDRISPVATVVNNIPIFTVSAVVDNSDGLMRPGMNSDLAIMISSDRGIVVPSRAVSTVRGRSYVDVYVDGEIETRRVETGGDDGVNLVVTEGLDEGALVVIPSAPVLDLSAAPAPAGSTGTSIIPISVPGTGGGGGR